jgi:hypothetical protein
MKYFFLLSVLFVLTLQSCSLQRRLDKYCPLCPVKESTIIETVYKDTNIYIPGETVTVVDSVYCDSLGNVYAMRLYQKDGDIISLKTQLKNNKYTVTAASDTIVKTIQLPSKTITKVVTLPPQIEQYIPWWASFLAVVGAIALIIVLISLAFRFLKNKLNTNLPLR